MPASRSSRPIYRQQVLSVSVYLASTYTFDVAVPPDDGVVFFTICLHVLVEKGAAEDLSADHAHSLLGKQLEGFGIAHVGASFGHREPKLSEGMTGRGRLVIQMDRRIEGGDRQLHLSLLERRGRCVKQSSLLGVCGKFGHLDVTKGQQA